MDVFSKEKRSDVMSKVRQQNTAPELIIRKILFSAGFRYRLNDKKLRGRPDMVLRKHKTVIFVHGCFWHGCHCRVDRLPKNNATYWLTKIAKNMQRDKENMCHLSEIGWRVLTVWECGLFGKRKMALSSLAQKLVDWIFSKELVGQISGC